MSYVIYENFGTPEGTTSAETRGGGRPLMEIQNIQHKKKLLQESEIVVVDIYGTWCEPCKKLAPQLEQLATDYADKAVFTKENMELGLTQNIQAVPTLHVFVKGRLAQEFIGGDLRKLRTYLNSI